MNIQEKELIKLTSRLISFKTVSGNHKEIKKCLLFIKKYLGGFKFKEYSKNGERSIVIFDGADINRKKFDLIFLCHIDVVPANLDQFKARISGGRLYGRGAGDMKSGTAVAISLMKNLRPKNTALILTSDEEIGGENGALYLSRIGYKADLVIALEPSCEKITTRHKGFLRIKITAKGKSCHSSRPWFGINAIEKLISLYPDIKKEFQLIKPDDDFKNKWQKTMNLGMISGGEVCNKVPQKAEMDLDIRYTEKENPAKIVSRIKKISELHGCNAKLLERGEYSYTSRTDYHVKKLADISGLNFKSEYGASDTRYFTSRGIPAVELGPLDKNIHGENEYVLIKSMAKIYRILENFIKAKKN